MEGFILSKHAKKRMEARHISIEIVDAVLDSPDRVLQVSEKQIFQSIILEDSRK